MTYCIKAIHLIRQSEGEMDDNREFSFSSFRGYLEKYCVML